MRISILFVTFVCISVEYQQNQQFEKKIHSKHFLIHPVGTTVPIYSVEVLSLRLQKLSSMRIHL